jgi:hypothetical protein
MEYREANFHIHASNNTITFSGALEKTVYTDVVDFLNEVEKQIADDSIILDLHSLEFLNSTGIRMLAVFLTGSTKNFQLIYNKAFSWQKNALSAMQQIKPSAIQLSEH